MSDSFDNDDQISDGVRSDIKDVDDQDVDDMGIDIDDVDDDIQQIESQIEDDDDISHHTEHGEEIDHSDIQRQVQTEVDRGDVDHNGIHHNHTQNRKSASYRHKKHFDSGRMSSNAGSDFKKAYGDLTLKFQRGSIGDSTSAQTLMASLASPKEMRQHRRRNMSLSDQVQMSNRLSSFKEKSKLKVQDLAKQRDEEELAGCTFTPRLSQTTTRLRETRSLSRFLEDQKKFEATKREKVVQKSKEKEEEVFMQTQMSKTSHLCPGTRTLVQSLRKSNPDISLPAHERLHKVHKDRMTHKLNSMMQSGQGVDDLLLTPLAKTTGGMYSQPMFSPRINKKSQHMLRTEKIDVMLYNDARRREEKQKQNTVTKPITNKKNLAPQTERVLTKQYSIHLSELFDEIDTEKSGTLNYTKLGELMRRLHFLGAEPEEEPRYTQERILLYEMWRVLKGEENRCVSYDNVKIFTLAIQNLRDGRSKVPTHLVTMKAEDEANAVIETRETAVTGGVDEGHGEDGTAKLVTDHETHSADDGSIEKGQSRHSFHDDELEGSGAGTHSPANLSANQETNGQDNATTTPSVKVTDNERAESPRDRVMTTESNPQSPSKVLNIGVYDREKKRVYFSSSEVSKVHEMFNVFYRNRSTRSGGRNSITKKKALESEEFSFQPQISAVNRTLAQKNRQKLMESARESIISPASSESPKKLSYTEATVLLERAKFKDLEKRRKEQKDQELQSCTFKPTISAYSDDQRKSLGIESGKSANQTYRLNSESDEALRSSLVFKEESQKNGDLGEVEIPSENKVFVLYGMKDIYSKRLKTDISTDEAEFIKAKEECTFRPDTTPGSKSMHESLVGDSHYWVGGVENNVKRMKNAHKEKMRIKEMTNIKDPSEDHSMRFGLDYSHKYKANLGMAQRVTSRTRGASGGVLRDSASKEALSLGKRSILVPHIETDGENEEHINQINYEIIDDGSGTSES